MSNTNSKAKTSKKENSYLASECDKIGEIATHYGFAVIKPPHVEIEDIGKSRQFRNFDLHKDADEKTALTRWFLENGQENAPQPVLIHYRKPLPGSQMRKKTNQDSYGFEIMGSVRATSEALAIKCALSTIQELGHKDIYIDINTIGDKESIFKFERELGSYTRKHIASLPAKVRNELKKNPYSILTDNSPELKEFRENMPQTIASLSDISRLYFKEVLEYLESFGVPYKINPYLFSNKLYATHTVFEIKETVEGGENELLVYGYRYNHLARKIGAKREIPSVGLTLFSAKNQKNKTIPVRKIKRPKFYLAQLGDTAKLKVLNIVEMLRQEKIPVYHSVTKDKITGQLSGAEYMKASHVLIIGQKEAVENTVLVRNIVTREQETLPIATLADFLRKL